MSRPNAGILPEQSGLIADAGRAIGAIPDAIERGANCQVRRGE